MANGRRTIYRDSTRDRVHRLFLSYHEVYQMRVALTYPQIAAEAELPEDKTLLRMLQRLIADGWLDAVVPRDHIHEQTQYVVPEDYGERVKRWLAKEQLERGEVTYIYPLEGKCSVATCVRVASRKNQRCDRHQEDGP